MASTLLRERIAGRHANVTFVELFFDLVFVFAVTQVSHSLVGHLTWLGAFQAMLLLMAVWWAWIYSAWITNWLDPEHASVRLMLFALMVVGLIMSSALLNAFGDRGLVFAGAYVAFQLGRTLFMLRAARDNLPFAKLHPSRDLDVRDRRVLDRGRLSGWRNTPRTLDDRPGRGLCFAGAGLLGSRAGQNRHA